MKRILFFNPKRKKCNIRNPHIGLAMLSAVLKRAGHQVQIVDYQFCQNAIAVNKAIEEFRPDIIGVSLATSTMKETDEIIDIVSRFDFPLLVGGPHATLYSEELIGDNRIDYIVKGEAEEIITKLIEEASPQRKPKIIDSILPDVSELPFPDFTSFFGYDIITDYPLITSRGCPYNCSFCAVHLINSGKWRARSPRDCIDELKEAKRRLPNLIKVGIFDDAPMVDPRHIKEILRLYLEEEINLPVVVSNSRADNLDEEIMGLLKKCGCPSVCLGVEHGHPDVFNNINKGETLEEIIDKARLIKKYGFALYLCFIIGLPGDSLDKTKYSIRLAKELNADQVFWNNCIPFKGTRVREMFDDSRAGLRDLINRSSYVDGDFVCDEPCVDTPEFSISERKKAYFMAILETGHPRLNWDAIPRLVIIVFRYGLYISFFRWLYRRIKNSRLKTIFKTQHE